MERVILQFMCVGSLAGVTNLRYTVLTSSKERNSCPLLRSSFIGSCHVGVSKRFSRSISLAVYCLYTFFGAHQVSCRSYVGSAYRMRSLAVSHSEKYCPEINASARVVFQPMRFNVARQGKNYKITQVLCMFVLFAMYAKVFESR